MSVLERVQRDQLGQLTTENLGGSTEVMYHDLACLLVLGKVTTFVESTLAGAVHVELWRSVQLDNECTKLLRRALGSRADISLDEINVLDPRKWIFNLVARRVIIDVISNASFFGRVENDEVHLALTDSSPRANGEGATIKVLDDCNLVSLLSSKAVE